MPWFKTSLSAHQRAILVDALRQARRLCSAPCHGGQNSCVPRLSSCFPSLTSLPLVMLPCCPQVEFKAGQVIFSKGDPGTDFFIIREVRRGLHVQRKQLSSTSRCGITRGINAVRRSGHGNRQGRPHWPGAGPTGAGPALWRAGSAGQRGAWLPPAFLLLALGDMHPSFVNSLRGARASRRLCVQPRAADVVAEGRLVCYTLSSKDFATLLGSREDIWRFEALSRVRVRARCALRLPVGVVPAARGLLTGRFQVSGVLCTLTHPARRCPCSST